MDQILENMPAIKLPSFLSCLTNCERQSCTVSQFVMAYQIEANVEENNFEKKHEALLGEIDFVK